jgi:hypothetical protein
LDIDGKIRGQWFIVEDISLFYSTFRFQSSNHTISISNHALASAHCITVNESENAVISLKLSFENDGSKLETLRSSLVSFIKSKPKEWLSCSAMHLVKVDINTGISEYSLRLKHCESWRKIDKILESKALLEKFCHQLGKNVEISVECMPLHHSPTVI